MKVWTVEIELKETYDVVTEDKDEAIELALKYASEEGSWCVAISCVDEEIS